MDRDKTIVTRAKKMLKELDKENDQLLDIDYKVKSEWHRLLYANRIKAGLIREILGIE